MARFRTGRVVQIHEQVDDIVRATVETGSGEAVEAVGFPGMLGPLALEDRVVVNTVGIDLELGTGGTAFILWNLARDEPVEQPEGHIVKLRYSPWQMNVLSAEAPESDHHGALEEVD